MAMSARVPVLSARGGGGVDDYVDPSVVQLREVQQIIKITTKSLKELDRQFAGLENPPSIYIEVSLCGY